MLVPASEVIATLRILFSEAGAVLACVDIDGLLFEENFLFFLLVQNNACKSS
jgi:hypothetical protein